jgi:hypothetical protein
MLILPWEERRRRRARAVEGVLLILLALALAVGYATCEGPGSTERCAERGEG